MDTKSIDRIVINERAVTVRMKQSRVDQQRVTANDFIKIASAVGQSVEATPLVKEAKDHREFWIRFERY